MGTSGRTAARDRNGRRLHDGEGRRRRPGDQGDPLERLPAAPDEAAREGALELLEAIVGAFPDHPRDGWRMFLTGSGAAPLCAPTGGKFVQEVNAVTLAVEHLHPDVGSRHRARRAGREDHHVQEGREDGRQDRRPPSMNDKCASGTGATIDKCMLKVERAAGARHDAPLRRLEAPPRRGQVRRVRRDRHRQPDQERHPRRTRCSARSPTRSSCRTSACSRAATR